ncbi:MAG: hypothetical protein JWL64_2353 [Frankiales bacterium]|nr:hypothetical protein [Frankiales bacterium]
MSTAAEARSLLFVPGDRPERFDKAAASGADLVVLDLEDAVLPAAKPAARRQVAAWLAEAGQAVVRVNATDSADLGPDLEALRGRPGLTAVLVPMSDDPDALARVHRRLGVPVIALVETAAGVLRAADLARAEGVVRLAFGHLDFLLDIDGTDDPATLLTARSMLVLASRAAGLAGPVDGVTTDLRDPDRTAADALAARKLGFGGKLCIHPTQVAPVHQAFAPTPAEVAWAADLLTAAKSAGASQVGGHMIDAPVLERARRVLARDGAHG